MKIVNPIYDNAFKYLMDNEHIAKIVISIILDTKVVSLQSKPQETPLTKIDGITVSRYDFKAVIKTESGDDKTVLIELQKYKTPNPVSRFRQYLAQNYMKEEAVIIEKGKEEIMSLPIISIYILGFDLPEFNCKAIRIDNQPYDIVGQEKLSIKSDFVELLTHQCFILIAVDKPNLKKSGSRLEKFLNLFLQKLKGAEANTIIDVSAEQEDNEIQTILTHLNQATLNQKLIRTLSAEKEHAKGIESLEKDLQEAKAREEEERRQKEEERRQKEEAKAREKEKSIKLAKRMLKYNEPIEEIIEDTGLSKEEVEKLK